jgi:hypothetical protein
MSHEGPDLGDLIIHKGNVPGTVGWTSDMPATDYPCGAKAERQSAVYNERSQARRFVLPQTADGGRYLELGRARIGRDKRDVQCLGRVFAAVGCWWKRMPVVELRGRRGTKEQSDGVDDERAGTN